jgi:hypothetical protein
MYLPTQTLMRDFIGMYKPTLETVGQTRYNTTTAGGDVFWSRSVSSHTAQIYG